MKIAFLHNSAPSDFQVIGSHRAPLSQSDFDCYSFHAPVQCQATVASTSAVEKNGLCCESSEKYPITFLLSLQKGSTDDDRLIFIGA